MLLLPDMGPVIVMLLLCVSLFAYGIRTLWYYFTMARHMVGGRLHLYLGVIVIDLGLVTLALSNIPQMYIMLYLLILYVFSGAVSILRALESKKNGAHWKWKLTYGIINLLIAAACGVFIRSGQVMVYIYCIGLVYSAVTRIIGAFRRTAVVYIQ